MHWNNISTVEQIETIRTNSFVKPQLIFKHSTTCSISKMVLNRLERAETPDNIVFNYLDLLSFRPISNAIAEEFKVHHESPQVLLIKNGECVFEESHYAISMDEIVEQSK